MLCSSMRSGGVIVRPTHLIAGVLLIVVLFAGVSYLRRPAPDGHELIQRQALEYYKTQNPGVTGVSARYVNYGCHFEVDIMQNGERIARLGWAGPGNFYELGR